MIMSRKYLEMIMTKVFPHKHYISRCKRFSFKPHGEMEFPISLIQLSQDGPLYIYNEGSQIIIFKTYCISFCEDRLGL